LKCEGLELRPGECARHLHDRAPAPAAATVP
jgi:hypothetical protein